MKKDNTATTGNQPQKKQTPWDIIKETCKKADETIPEKNKTRISNKEMIYQKNGKLVGRYGDIKDNQSQKKQTTEDEILGTCETAETTIPEKAF